MRLTDIKQKYGLIHHDHEGGWYSVIFDNDKGGNIYYLLGPSDFSRIHRIKVDEMWHFLEGCPLNLYLFHENDRVEKVVLNSDESRQYLVPAGCWMGACPSQPGDYSFLGCSVWGKFRLEDVEYAEYEGFVKNFPGHQELVRKLIP